MASAAEERTRVQVVPLHKGDTSREAGQARVEAIGQRVNRSNCWLMNVF
jgi:hypothetical protein